MEDGHWYECKRVKKRRLSNRNAFWRAHYKKSINNLYKSTYHQLIKIADNECN